MKLEQPPVAAKASRSSSVTREEIRRFWVQRKMKEEDHLLAAQKAAARKKARNLTKEDYARFEEFLKITLYERSNSKYEGTEISRSEDDYDVGTKELRIGIKNWWTKSKYAYLNQPTINPKGCAALSSTSTSVLGVF